MNSFIRNIGGSIGIAVISASITRQIAKHQNYMVARAVPGSKAFDQMIGSMNQMLARKGAPMPNQQAYGRVSELIAGHATTLAYIDVISFLAIMVVSLVPFVLIMRRPKRAAAAAQAAH